MQIKKLKMENDLIWKNKKGPDRNRSGQRVKRLIQTLILWWYSGSRDRDWSDTRNSSRSSSSCTLILSLTRANWNTHTQLLNLSIQQQYCNTWPDISATKKKKQHCIVTERKTFPTVLSLTAQECLLVHIFYKPTESNYSMLTSCTEQHTALTIALLYPQCCIKTQGSVNLPWWEEAVILQVRACYLAK